MSKKEVKKRLSGALTELRTLFPGDAPSKKELASAINFIAEKYEIQYVSLYAKYKRSLEAKEKDYGNCLLTKSQEAQIAGSILYLDQRGEPVTKKMARNTSYTIVRHTPTTRRSLRWHVVS